MCLLIKGKFKNKETALAFFAKPNIAKNDITVYKVLEVGSHGKCIFSPYKCFEYHPETIITVSLFGYNKHLFKRDKQLNIEEGLHSFTKRKDAQKMADLFKSCFVVKCLIPKGTKYFLGVSGDDEITPNYVSLALQMPKVIDTSKATINPD